MPTSRRRFLVRICAVTVSTLCGGSEQNSVDASSAGGSGVRYSASRCPRRLINCPFPGRCYSSRNSNGSGHCDLSDSV